MTKSDQCQRARLAKGKFCDDDPSVTTAMCPSRPDASAQFIGRVARLSGNVRQPNHILGNEIAGHKAERRPGAGEEWLAATKHDGAEVESILINKTKVG
ncbi:MAG: hypothetical protein WAM39_13930 [Bryobacteraceae bacterium]